MTEKTTVFIKEGQMQQMEDACNGPVVQCLCGGDPDPMKILPPIPSAVMTVPEGYDFAASLESFFGNEGNVFHGEGAALFTDVNFMYATHPVPGKSYEVHLEQFLGRDDEMMKVMLWKGVDSLLKKHGAKAVFANAPGLVLVEQILPTFLPFGVQIISPDMKDLLFKDEHGYRRVATLSKLGNEVKESVDGRTHYLPLLAYADGPVQEEHYFLVFKEI